MLECRVAVWIDSTRVRLVLRSRLGPEFHAEEKSHVAQGKDKSPPYGQDLSTI